MSDYGLELQDLIINYFRRYFKPEAATLLAQYDLVFTDTLTPINYKLKQLVFQNKRTHDVPLGFTEIEVSNHKLRLLGNDVCNNFNLPKAVTNVENLSYKIQNTHIFRFNSLPQLLELILLSDETDMVLDEHLRPIYETNPNDCISWPYLNDFCYCILHIICSDYDILPTTMVRPVQLTLSHDLDSVSGNDPITQFIRLYRCKDNINNLKYVIYNIFRPNEFHFENLKKIIDLEISLGFGSNLYILTGRRGRLHARSSQRKIKNVLRKLLNLISSKHQIGLHYNYDTYNNCAKLQHQKMFIEKIIEKKIHMGRGHYLRIDFQNSVKQLSNIGIKIDETLGFPNNIGFRMSAAAIIDVKQNNSPKAAVLKHLPLFAMDAPHLVDYQNGFKLTQSILEHLTIVGGHVTFLFHHDLFENPEFPDYFDYYKALLSICKRYSCEYYPMEKELSVAP